MKVELQQRDEGIVLPVRAAPGSQQNDIRGIHNGALRVAVTAAPEKGRANKAIIAVLVKQLGLKKSQIELLSGTTSKEKSFLIRGVAMKDLSDTLSRF